MVRLKWKVLFKSEKNLETSEIINALLANRDIKTKKTKEIFLTPDINQVTSNSVGIDQQEIKKTIKRIKKAIEKNKKIVIFGDYDVDGICGTAILWETLFAFYKNVIPHIPHRASEGYGLSKAGIDHILKENSDVDLIITVDNGIVAGSAVDYAKEHGIDVIVTDHHVRLKTPSAFSIVHTTMICGAAVAYLLSKEIVLDFNVKNYNIDSHLELVALATVADLVPLIGPNRALARFGIDSLRKTNRPGLIALFNQAQIKRGEVDVYKIGHVIAPRLNAAGRIAHALDSLRLICTKDPVRAKKLAIHLDQTNRERQLLTEESTSHANNISQYIKETEKIIFVHDENYNQGIIGLVASRLVERHYRPAIAIAVGEKISKGSARAIPGVNIIEFIRVFSHMLIDAGGHPAAAGFTIETERIEEFKKALVEHAGKQIGLEILQKVLKIDLQIPLSVVNTDFYGKVQTLGPFGMGNPEPVFLTKNVVIENSRSVGSKGNHIKLQISQNDAVLDAILFNQPETSFEIGAKADIVYTVALDKWQDRQQLQLKIKDIALVN